MPQSDKEITEVIGIPRLTLHSWKTGNGYTRLLYSILKNMSVSELKEKREIAEKVFDLLIISREKLYQRLFAKLNEHLPVSNKISGDMGGLEYVKDIEIIGKNDMLLIRKTKEQESIDIHYILKGSHTRATFKKFVNKFLEILSVEFDVPASQINLFIYGAHSVDKLSSVVIVEGKPLQTYVLNEILGINKEIIIMNSLDEN